MRWKGPILVVVVCAVLAFILESEVETEGDWLQWGGPNRDFSVTTPGLSDTWPAGGPPLIWQRPLGDGYSTILAQGGTLYTMYRRSTGEREGQEVVVALDADNGHTRWDFRYDEPLPDKLNASLGPGPKATPLIAGKRLFSVSVMAKVHALDKKTGRLLWSRDLYNELSMERIGTKSNRGYSSSPIAYRETLILPVGGPGQAVVSLHQGDGSVVWKRHDFELAPSSPILIDVDGQEQLVLFMGSEIIGLDPATGDLFWSYPHKTDYDCNISTPIWGEDNLLYISSAYNSGSRVLELRKENGATSVRKLWFSRRMRIHFGSAIRVGDMVYGSSGDFGPAFFVGVDVRSGEVAWRQRGLAKAQIVMADDQFVIVDEDGLLALATPGPKRLRVRSKFQLFNSRSWTAPTLVGSRLYVRDRETIVALELGK